jgi:hypothetical protein
LEGNRFTPNQLLVEGLQSDYSEIVYASLLDLTMIAKFQTSRRLALYQNVNHWKIVLSKCCEIINTLTETLQEATLDQETNPSTRHWILQMFSRKFASEDWSVLPPGPNRSKILFRDTQLVMWSAEGTNTEIDFTLFFCVL